ncbi:MAG: peptidylprolyl isomerase [Steroidobacteraceae bacterium]|jgi:peptidyl-prolyl cis-trans isomerase C
MLFVGDTPISEADIAREMQHHRAGRPEESRAAAARALVVRELLRREIERLGLATEARAIGQESAEEAGIRLLLEREITDRVPTEDDCRRYFEQNSGRFRSPDRIRVRHILLSAPADDVKGRYQARLDAEEMIARLGVNPALFADFALRRSDCPSKSEGGDLGWLERGQTTPEFDRQVFRLPAGLAAFPVESRWGYHIIQIDALESGVPLGFDAVHRRIADYLELQVRQRELQHYLESLREHYGVRGLAEIEALADSQVSGP